MILLLILATAGPPVAAVSASSTTIAATPLVRDIDSPDGFRIGVDTAATVIAKLGKPAFSQTSSDGSSILLYNIYKAHIKGASFIPYAGLFTGGAKMHNTTKTFTFGTDGMLKTLGII